MWWPLIGDVHGKLPKPFLDAASSLQGVGASQVRVALDRCGIQNGPQTKSILFTRGKRSEANSDQPSLINQQPRLTLQNFFSVFFKQI